MSRATLLVVLIVAACARSNRSLLDDLEEQAVLAPRPDADRILESESWELPFAAGAGQVTLPMEDASLPVVMGAVNGVEVPLVLDTGASLVMLSGRGARAARLYLPPGDPIEAISPGYNPNYRRGVVDAVEFDGLRFGPGAVGVPSKEASGRAPGGISSKIYGIAGCPVLGHFVVTFDFKAHEVRLVPHRGRASAPLFVEATVNNGTYWFLVDSGASRIYLEPWAALELGLISEQKARRYRSKSSAFGKGKVTRVEIESMEVAGETFAEVDAGVVRTFGTIRHSAGWRPAGLLGLAGLGEGVWVVDFAAQTLSVEP